jgi:hypothetical protein
MKQTDVSVGSAKPRPSRPLTIGSDETMSAAVSAAVAELDALNDYDPEEAHGAADAVLWRFAPDEVRAAYDRARQRVGFWYA